MEKRKFSIRDIFNLRNLIKFIIALVVDALFIVIFLWIKGFNLVNLVDASFIAGGITFLVGGFQIVANSGFFDVIVVGFANLSAVFKKNGTKKYDGLYEYRLVKEEKRFDNKYSSLSYFLAGIISLIIFLITYLNLY
ncbi:MAG: DUF3899 domain-containing protein [Firmicutes bacterium]|uniref:DUF3899 domain-containing protein n=1 Tax=Candidatus Onthovivens merdipullorum TaxID=2840889 RepID=A0A9D9DJ47_9BACL|nr:DUF3899 domain-containing protein [Candidatus Onthovivens merdipullorum]